MNAALNPIQLHILQMFNYTHSKGSLEDLKNLLAKHYVEKIDEEMDAIWRKKKMTQSKLKSLSNKPIRTPHTQNEK